MRTFQKILTTWCALILALASASASDEPPPLSTIVREVIAKDDANQKALQTMEYHETMRTERLNEKGDVMQRQQLWLMVRPGAPEEIQVLSEKGDALPIDPDEAALKAQGRQAAVQIKQMYFAFKDLVTRFTVTLAGRDVVQGQPAYVLAFEPKPNQPYRSQTEKVLNYLHGRMWISTRDYSVLRTQATLAAPVEIAWIFAQVNTLDFHYELDNTTGGMGPALTQVFVKVDAPFITFRQRMTVDMTQFQTRNKTN